MGRQVCLSRRGAHNLALQRTLIEYQNPQYLTGEQVVVKLLVDRFRMEGSTPSQKQCT